MANNGELQVTYTPILGRDPRGFTANGYTTTLSAATIMTCVTMYNEKPDELMLTLRGCCENLRTLTELTGDDDFWRKFAVCIVLDGREKADPTTVDFMESIGMYDGQLIANTLNQYGRNAVGCHLFEGSLVFEDTEETEFPPLQIMFALKEWNGGKIDSHWWFFEAFCASTNPKYSFLLDVGTRPRTKAMYHLFRAMERNDQIAGSCGEITTRSRTNASFIVGAQHFEYKIAGILDKAMESIFGYISVLPGAFSCYRLECLRGRPLRKYFYHIEHSQAELTPLEANMYLAEDRILCFELFASEDNWYTLHFVNDSVAETDVPDTIVSLIKQRRRWLNGSFFAQIYAILNFHRIITESSHSLFRKSAVCFLFLYYVLQAIAQWFLLGTFYLSLFFSMQIALEIDSSSYIFFGVSVFFLVIIVAQFVCGLGDSPTNLPWIYNASYKLLGLYFLAVFGFVLVVTQKVLAEFNDWFFLLSFSLSVGIYVLVTFIYGEINSVFSAFIQYLFLTPAFTIMFPIYSFCNVQDISWGTKGLDVAEMKVEKLDPQQLLDEAQRKAAEAKKASEIKNKFSRFRTYLVLFWMLCNGALVGAVSRFSIDTTVIQIIVVAVLVFNGWRMIGSLIYWVFQVINRRQEHSENAAEMRVNWRRRRMQPGEASLRKVPSKWSWLTGLILAPVKLSSWVAIFDILVAGPILAVLSFAYILVTSILAVYPFYFVPQVSGAFAYSWRWIAKLDFDYFSRDSSVALALGVDSASQGHRRREIPALQPGGTLLKDLTNDAFTSKVQMYFLLAKPFFVIVSAGISLLLLELSFVFFLGPALLDLCENTAQGCENSFIEQLNFLGFWIASPLNYIIGALVLFLFFVVVSHFDYLARKFISTLLGDTSGKLLVHRRLNLARGPSQLLKSGVNVGNQ